MALAFHEISGLLLMLRTLSPAVGMNFRAAAVLTSTKKSLMLAKRPFFRTVSAAQHSSKLFPHCASPAAAGLLRTAAPPALEHGRADGAAVEGAAAEDATAAAGAAADAAEEATAEGGAAGPLT